MKQARMPEPATVAVVLKGYPRLSETFIAQEILALQERGLRQHIVSLRHPTDSKRHPLHEAITAPVTYLPEYLYQEPNRVLRAWRTNRINLSEHSGGARPMSQLLIDDHRLLPAFKRLVSQRDHRRVSLAE